MKKKKSKKIDIVIANVYFYTNGIIYPIKSYKAIEFINVVDHMVRFIDIQTKKEIRWNGTFLIEYV